jgi:hypothetical protein
VADLLIGIGVTKPPEGFDLLWLGGFSTGIGSPDLM